MKIDEKFKMSTRHDHHFSNRNDIPVVDGEFVDETPKVILLFMLTALIYSLYEIF